MLVIGLCILLCISVYFALRGNSGEIVAFHEMAAAGSHDEL